VAVVVLAGFGDIVGEVSGQRLYVTHSNLIAVGPVLSIVGYSTSGHI
jgi:hypothetical protein